MTTGTRFLYDARYTVAPDSNPNLETRELREQLRQQTERLQLALHAAAMGTWEHIPATHETFWDARSKSIFGLLGTEPLNFDQFVAAIHPLDADAFFSGITKAMDPTGSGACSLQYRIKKRGEGWRWVEAHGRCTFENGLAVRINGTLRDISVRKEAEDAVRENERRKDEFLALLGHELRNPLAPIRTALDLMQHTIPGQAVRERDVIDRQLKHMMRLVDDLLDVARITRGTLVLKLETVELGTVVRRAVEMASPLFEAKRQRLRIEVPNGLRVSVDVVRLCQVLSNLLINAAKFTDEGGLISVTAGERDGQVRLEVSDEGAGIEAEQLERIFESFTQTERAPGALASSGLGLGLSLVRTLVRLHGGSVVAESEGLGRGSRFIVDLPQAATPLSEPAPAPKSDPPPGRRILLVDDNEDAAEMMALLLSSRGHVVQVANDSLRALSLAREFAPDVAVLDLGLPVVDGYELATRLITELAPKPIRLIAVTGYGQPSDRARTRAAGFNLHLVKPVDWTELEAGLD